MKKPESSETTRLSRPARKRNPDESRRRILDAAERAFALRGFDGARLRDIAQEAGIHHALVHHYYGDKRGLFHEVVQRGLGRVSTGGLEALSEASGPEQTVQAVVGAVFDFYAEHTDLIRIIEGAYRDKDSLAHEIVADAIGEFAVPLLTSVSERVSTAQKSGLLRMDVPASALVMYALGAIAYRFRASEGLALAMGMPAREQADLEKERRDVAAFVFAAMRAQR